MHVYWKHILLHSKNTEPYQEVACFLSVPCECVRKTRMSCPEVSCPTAPNTWNTSYTNFQHFGWKATLIVITFGCLMPKMKPHSDKSSEISQPTSSYCASWWMRLVDGCRMMRETPVLALPLSSRAQCAGVTGALLSHLFVDSERIPTTPFPSMI